MKAVDLAVVRFMVPVIFTGGGGGHDHMLASVSQPKLHLLF